MPVQQRTQFTGLILLLCHFSSIGWALPPVRISVSETGFVSEDYKQTERKDFQFISINVDTLRGLEKESEIEDPFQTQIQVLAAPGVSVLSYLNVSQLFWKQNDLTIGRKKIKWSLLDEDFNLGLYQPLFKWNSLNPSSQGLTGLFLNLENAEGFLPWGISLFGSGLFIPDQGPGYEIKSGQFEKTNPYFQAVPTRAHIEGQTVDINYQIKNPDTQSIVFNRSLVGRAFLGEEKKGFFAQVALANKPSNQLALGFDGELQMNATTTGDSTNLVIFPAIFYHSLASADVKFTAKNVGVGISAIHESPDRPQFDEAWTYVTYDKSDLTSPYIEFQAADLKFHLAHLFVAGGESQALGKFAQQSEKFLPQRYPFRNADLASLSYRHRFSRYRQLNLATRYLQGQESEFALWTTQLNYQWEERWALFLQSQMVAVQDNPQGRRTALWPFANNDSVAIGVNYVF